MQLKHKTIQQELEAARSKAAWLTSASEECDELKARLASARSAAAEAKQAAEQEKFQLQAQVPSDSIQPFGIVLLRLTSRKVLV